MSRHLAIPALYGTCSVCGQEIPATPAPAPYEGKAKLVVHDHPRRELGPCAGSRMVTWALGQLELFTVAEVREAA